MIFRVSGSVSLCGVLGPNKTPAHSYQYSFAPNPDWSNLYAPGSEIQRYLQDVAERFGATRFIKTSHEVKHCEWDGTQKLWFVRPLNSHLI